MQFMDQIFSFQIGDINFFFSHQISEFQKYQYIQNSTNQFHIKFKHFHTCNLQNPYNTRICSKTVLPRNKQKKIKEKGGISWNMRSGGDYRVANLTAFAFGTHFLVEANGEKRQGKMNLVLSPASRRLL